MVRSAWRRGSPARARRRTSTTPSPPYEIELTAEKAADDAELARISARIGIKPAGA
jgi:hypothetical protein